MTDNIAKDTQEKINQLSMMEQNMSSLVMQKQQLQQQLIEVESALSEITSSNECYKIVGNVMLKTDSKKLEKELMDKKETCDLRIAAIDKQQQKLKEKAAKTQAEVMEEIKEKKSK